MGENDEALMGADAMLAEMEKEEHVASINKL